MSTPEVWKNLNSQGVSRFVGFLIVMENFGIIEDVGQASSDAATVRLGAEGTPKAIAPQKRWTGLRKFVAGVRGAKSLPAPVDVASLRENDRRADEILRAVGKPLLAGPASRYVRPTIRRKRLRSMLLQLGPHAEQFWEGMTMKELQDIVPDMGVHLNSFDDNMLVTKVVAMFGLCPKVGAMLLPMAACFWKGAWNRDSELVLKCIRFPAAMARAHEAYKNKHGINCNPEILMTPPAVAGFLLPQ